MISMFADAKTIANALWTSFSMTSTALDETLRESQVRSADLGYPTFILCHLIQVKTLQK